MIQNLLVQILPQVLFLIITAIAGFIAALAKSWWNAHKGLIEAQKQQVIQTINPTGQITNDMK